MGEHALKWWQVRWGLAGRIISRFAIVLGKIVAVVCVIALIAYSAFYLLSPWIFAQNLKSVPSLNLIPVSLSNKAEASLSGTTLDRYGFKIQMPANAVVHLIKGVTMADFRDGALRIEYPAEQDHKDRALIEIVNENESGERLLGNETFRSKFKLMQAAMTVTPAQVKWWRLRFSQNERAGHLLAVKFFALTSSFSPHAWTTGPIYTISSGGIRGFQLGNPDAPPYEAHLDLYDATDAHLVFDIAGPERHGQVLTQQEINAIVSSIRPTLDR